MPKEVEFVCTNTQTGSPVTTKNQESLMTSLSSVPGLHVYRQDWGHLDEGQTSLAAIIKHDAPKHTMQTIRSLSKRHGVPIDMVNDVDDSHVDRVASRDIEGITHYFNT